MEIKAVISNDLTIEEINQLGIGGKAADDYAALMLPAVGLQAAPQRTSGGQSLLVFQVTVMIPEDTLRLPGGGVLGANGESATSLKAQQAIPVAPMVRFVVDRSILSPQAQANLNAQRAGIPPLPRFRSQEQDSGSK